MSEPKTPGEVAWEAYRSALIRTPADFRGLGGAYSSPAWEAAASAVRLQLEAEQRRTGDLLSAHVIRDIRTIRDIGQLVTEFHCLPVPADRDHNEEDKDDLINAIVAILDGPMPESAEACAEDAGAEPSKSPPPAKR